MGERAFRKSKRFEKIQLGRCYIPNGANRLIETVEELMTFKRLKIGVIGKATAEVFEKFGISVDLIPERTFSEGFLESISIFFRRREQSPF